LILRLANSELTDEVFYHVWARGEPILITRARAKFKLPWSPEYFIDHHGAEQCSLVDCGTDLTFEMKVEQFKALALSTNMTVGVGVGSLR
jgi:lysine-specific demethylase 3